MWSRRLRIAAAVAGFVALLTAAGCATASHGEVRSPAQLLASYQFDPDSPLDGRIVPAPPFVIEYLKGYDKVDTYDVYLPTDGEQSLARHYLHLLPSAYQSLLQSRLVGIYLIKDFIGSALTELVFDGADNPYAFIAVNPATLSTSMSAWATHRDLSSFRNDRPDIAVSTDCGTGYMGFLYAVLHETSHVVDFVSHPHPKAGDENAFPFVGRYWKGFDQPVARFDFPLRKKLSFYGLNGGPPLSIGDAPQAYRQLAATPFVSLYGSTSILEDYAELFTWTYYTRVLHQPYTITVRQADGTVTYAPMDNPLVRERSSELMTMLHLDGT